MDSGRHFLHELVWWQPELGAWKNHSKFTLGARDIQPNQFLGGPYPPLRILVFFFFYLVKAMQHQLGKSYDGCETHPRQSLADAQNALSRFLLLVFCFHGVEEPDGSPKNPLHAFWPDTKSARCSQHHVMRFWLSCVLSATMWQITPDRCDGGATVALKRSRVTS